MLNIHFFCLLFKRNLLEKIHLTFFIFQSKNIVPHSIEYAGKEWTSKIEALRKTLSEKNVGGMVISELVSNKCHMAAKIRYRTHANRPRSVYSLFPFFACGLFKNWSILDVGLFS